MEFFRIVESRDSWEWRAVAQILSWRSLLQQLLCLQVCSRFIWRRFFVKLFWGYLKLSGRLGKKLGNVVCCFFLSPPANHGCSSFSLLTLSYHGFLLIPLPMPSSSPHNIVPSFFFFLFTLQSLFLLLSSALLTKFLCSFLCFFLLWKIFRKSGSKYICFSWNLEVCTLLLWWWTWRW